MYVSVLYIVCPQDVTQSIGVSTQSNFTMLSICFLFVFAERGRFHREYLSEDVMFAKSTDSTFRAQGFQQTMTVDE